MKRKVIWKYRLEVTDQQRITIQAGAKPLHVALQGGSTWDGGALCLWAEVDVEAKPVQRYVYVMGTGHPFIPSSDDQYVGTVQDGSLVWHVYVGGETA